MHLGESQVRNDQGLVSGGSFPDTLRTRLRNVELDEGAGIEEENQRRSSMIISEANLPRLGATGSRKAVRSGRLR